VSRGLDRLLHVRPPNISAESRLQSAWGRSRVAYIPGWIVFTGNRKQVARVHVFGGCGALQEMVIECLQIGFG
jgi:hypothetical protein